MILPDISNLDVCNEMLHLLVPSLYISIPKPLALVGIFPLLLPTVPSPLQHHTGWIMLRKIEEYFLSGSAPALWSCRNNPIDFRHGKGRAAVAARSLHLAQPLRQHEASHLSVSFHLHSGKMKVQRNLRKWLMFIH